MLEGNHFRTVFRFKLEEKTTGFFSNILFKRHLKRSKLTYPILYLFLFKYLLRLILSELCYDYCDTINRVRFEKPWFFSMHNSFFNDI